MPSLDQITFHPRVGPEALALVKRFEGFRADAAPLAQGGFVVGYGHVLSRDLGRPVSPAEAEALLRYDLSGIARVIEPLVLAPVSDRQFDVLLSFAFGVGVQAFKGSPVLRRLNAGAYLDAAAALELWRVARIDGEPLVVDALVRRRAAEKAHFLEPPAGFAPAPSAVLRPEQDEAALSRCEALAASEPRAVLVDVEEARASTRTPAGQGEPAPSSALAAVAALSARLDRVLAKPPEPPAEPPPPVTSAPEHPNERGVSATELWRDPGVGAAAPRVSFPSPRSPAVLMGIVGLLVFALAVFRIYKAPSLGGLALGVLGVVAMAPAAMLLATPRRRDDG